MFTGLIQEIGTLAASVPTGSGRQLEISCSRIYSGLEIGDSVSCNGVCLTVTHLSGSGFKAFAVSETLAKSNLGNLSIGAQINLEPALAAGSKLGGHFVSGHVDGLGKVSKVTTLSDSSRELSITVPPELSRYCISKGSIALNGISLTIADIQENTLTIALIPLTLKETNMGSAAVGSIINLEVDMMGKYIEKMLEPYTAGRGNISEELLRNMGYHA